MEWRYSDLNIQGRWVNITQVKLIGEGQTITKKGKEGRQEVAARHTSKKNFKIKQEKMTVCIKYFLTLVCSHT